MPFKFTSTYIICALSASASIASALSLGKAKFSLAAIPLTNDSNIQLCTSESGSCDSLNVTFNNCTIFSGDDAKFNQSILNAVIPINTTCTFFANPNCSSSDINDQEKLVIVGDSNLTEFEDHDFADDAQSVYCISTSVTTAVATEEIDIQLCTDQTCSPANITSNNCTNFSGVDLSQHDLSIFNSTILNATIPTGINCTFFADSNCASLDVNNQEKLFIIGDNNATDFGNHDFADDAQSVYCVN